MNRRTFLTALVVLVSCFGLAFVVVPGMVGPVFASEGYGQHLMGGEDDFMMGAIPPPGAYFVNYSASYNANKLVGNNGSRISLAGPGIPKEEGTI